MPFDVDAVSTALGGRAVLWLEQTDSTMLDAARLAIMGGASGTIVGAESQTAGQGRHGRSWHSMPNGGLYVSFVLRLPLPPEQLPLVTMAAGLAAAEAIIHISGVSVDLRWPNDVMIGNQKLCGILVQHHGEALVAGFGINVNQPAFPEELSTMATSLRLTTGREFPREALCVELAQSLDRHLDVLVNQGKDAILKLFAQSSSYIAGRRVVVDQGEVLLRGTTDGLDENGFLILRQDDGTRTLILAGGVRPA